MTGFSRRVKGQAAEHPRRPSESGSGGVCRALYAPGDLSYSVRGMRKVFVGKRISDRKTPLPVPLPFQGRGYEEMGGES